MRHALAVARRVQARRRPARDKVFAWNTGAESGRRRARRGAVGLTEGVGHWRGSLAAEERRCSYDGGSSDDRRWLARSPTTLGKKGEGEAHRN
jgi:hypothetical protein